MKRISILVAAAALIGTISQGQTVTQVVSRNAVGYVKLGVPAGGFVMASVPFNAVGDTTPRSVDEIFGDQLSGAAGINPGASDKILKYIAEDQAYQIFWKSTDDGTWRDFVDFFNPTTNTLAPGEAFFISSIQTTDQVVFLMGEVPDSISVPTGTETVPVIQGFNQIAYSFPTEIGINDTSLSDNVAPGPITGDILARWNVGLGQYDLYFYDDGSFFPPNIGWKGFSDFQVTTDKLFPAEGVFLQRKSAASFNWDEVKPYTWP